MSSTYRAICLSHDPAIVLEDAEYHGSHGREWAEEADLSETVSGHEHCDLAVGRWSGALVELGCPERSHQNLRHRGARWLDAEWLQLLLAASAAAPDPALKAAVERANRLAGCWSHERLDRLRFELGVEPLPNGEYRR